MAEVSTKRWPIIDTDTHIAEPADLWTSRVPAAQRELVPHVVEVDGQQRWVANKDTDIGSAMPFSVVRKDGSKELGLGWFEWGIEDRHEAIRRAVHEVIRDRFKGLQGKGVRKIEPVLLS